ncbi:hypothetical protein P3X46_029615 [Hevea brasiliensis]|uniref:Uncharacterized protein n=2 Tax=Hevea brasiliensis TaxID=3981 RepID=A0ABQ9KVV6_HEVBR|nr:hypothetical protein P3X46_029606 [Hevea brasiliensis]KAJ9147453.1 hypothetical protein P3X46_029615 [Hevea brasiliensis]
MSPAATSTPSIHVWHSPIPFLFGGLAVMLTLIAAALIVLACSHRKNSSRPAASSLDLPVEAQPKIVVILAGDDQPTCIATPLASSTTSCQHV